jgi:hypothetical protein
VGCVLVAVLESYQNGNGSVTIYDVLRQDTGDLAVKTCLHCPFCMAPVAFFPSICRTGVAQRAITQ